MSTQNFLKSVADFSVWFKGLFSNEISQTNLSAKIQLEKEVDTYIQSGQLDQILLFIKHNYIFTTQQLQNLVLKQPSWFDNQPHNSEAQLLKEHIRFHYSSEIRSIVEKGINALQQSPQKYGAGRAFNAQSSIESFLENRYYLDGNKNDGLRTLLHNSYQNIEQAYQIAGTYLTLFPAIFYGDKAAYLHFQSHTKNFLSLFEKTKPVFKEYQHKTLTMEEWAKWKTESFDNKVFYDMEKTAKQIDTVLAEQSALFLTNTEKNTIDLLKQVYQTDPVAHLQKSIQENIQTQLNLLDKKSLPQEAWGHIEAIQTVGTQIKLDTLDTESQFEVKNLLGKVLGEVVQEYLAISSQHRAELKNEKGQGVEDILLESLETIYAQLKSKTLTQAQQEFKNLQSTHRYLKAKM